jgi:cell division protein FtsI (penicillin-binding protein 3)
LPGLAARAAYVQVFGNDFFQRQGEVRFARTLELPANRGASWIAMASSWPPACRRPASGPFPKTWTQDARGACQAQELARCWACRWPTCKSKLADEDKTFVWLKRQLDWDRGPADAALDIKGIYQRKEYKRQYPEGEAAHVVGFTNVEDKGQEGMELAFNMTWPAAPARAA